MAAVSVHVIVWLLYLPQTKADTDTDSSGSEGLSASASRAGGETFEFMPEDPECVASLCFQHLVRNKAVLQAVYACMDANPAFYACKEDDNMAGCVEEVVPVCAADTPGVCDTLSDSPVGDVCCSDSIRLSELYTHVSTAGRYVRYTHATCTACSRVAVEMQSGAERGGGGMDAWWTHFCVRWCVCLFVGLFWLLL
eukprot:GDKI01006804.1.p1 GENE.GDKI01006804.1~~GDKI01006804.1.p1  ORF type:complete len:196 (-),score=53.12 GDKI01006804.1:572-1159(-)